MKGSHRTEAQTPFSAAAFRHCTKNNGVVHLDVGGTLVVSEPVHIQSWVDLAKSYGVTLAEPMFDQEQDLRLPGTQGSIRAPLRGSCAEVVALWIIDQMPEGSEKPTAAVVEQRFMEKFLENKSSLRAREGIQDTVEDLYNSGYLLGTVTGSKLPIYEANLSQLKKISSLFDFSVTAEETVQHKPHPAPYVEALKKVAYLTGNTKASPDYLFSLAKRSFVIEDTASGVMSALKANMPCVQLVDYAKEPFNKIVPDRPLHQWVFPAKDQQELRVKINKIAGSFKPPAPKI